MRRSSIVTSLAWAVAMTLAATSPLRAGSWQPLVPSQRYGQSAILDPIRHRVLLFGGADHFSHNEVFAIPLLGSHEPIWLPTLGAPPRPRNGQSAVYDPVGDRVIVFGGASLGYEPEPLGYTNEVWSLSLGGIPTWSPLAPSGSGPVPRLGPSAMYDPLQHRMIVFGGIDPSTGLGTDSLWALSLGVSPAWAPLVPIGAGPSPRAWQSAVYDGARKSMLVFAGYADTSQNDVWSLSLDGPLAWTKLEPSGDLPPVRFGPIAVMDSASNRMIVCGGTAHDFNGYDDSWALTLGSTPHWDPLALIGQRPAPRWIASGVLDPDSSRVLMFGGAVGNPMNPILVRDDAWQLSLAGGIWSPLSPGSAARPRSRNVNAIYDPDGDRMIGFGSMTTDASYGTVNHLVAMDLEPPYRRSIPFEGSEGPPPRDGTSLVYDSARHRILVFGGANWTGDSVFADTWSYLLDGPTGWTKLAVQGSPSARFHHCAIYDAQHDRMLVFGGQPEASAQVVESLDLSGTPTWSTLSTAGSPPYNPLDPSSIYDSAGDRMLVFGSLYGNNSVWSLSLDSTPTWNVFIPSNSITGPYPRYQNSAIYDPVRQCMVIFGGRAAFPFEWSNVFRDTWSLSLGAQPQWTQLEAGPIYPSPRFSHAAIFDPVRDRMVVIGGDYSDAWALPLSATTAVNLPAVPATDPASEFVLCRPNPAMNHVEIVYSLPRREHVTLRIFDLAGREIASLFEGDGASGLNTARWDGVMKSGGRAPAGVYLYALRHGRTIVTRRFVLLD